MKKRAKIQGYDVDLMTFDEVIFECLDSIKNNKVVHLETINPEIIQQAKKNPVLKKVLHEAEIVTPDGVGIQIALKLKGISQEKVTGVDLSYRMLDECEKAGIPVALIGAKPEILNLATQNIKTKHPNINIVCTNDGYFSDFSPIIDKIVNSGAKFILCAMGAPKQELFIYELKKRMQCGVMIGVGGTFDVFSGCVKLAPEIYRKLGLEWLYRTIKQPERFKRIFPTLPIFFFQSIIDSIVSKD